MGLRDGFGGGGRTLCPGWLLDLLCGTDTDKSEVWLELLEGLWGIVNEGEAGGLAATELGLETEDVDLLLGALVQLSELATEVVLGHVGAVWVQDVTVVKMLAFTLSHFHCISRSIPAEQLPQCVFPIVRAVFFCDRGLACG